MKQNETIDILMPNYNGEKFIQKTYTKPGFVGFENYSKKFAKDINKFLNKEEISITISDESTTTNYNSLLNTIRITNVITGEKVRNSVNISYQMKLLCGLNNNIITTLIL